ncbi:phosphoglycolate phosphatase [Desulfosarcina ovata subsp. sediminis]|uniref:phosphoglycolate phosphatase n=1 Tax=Desulfosarcina ovata subsp. sediminis TaxID=885957 RepID=A0A5K7ZXG3_9BACT|nr:HAD-IA family hydrolase [Desulfosarcina ovata]BBO84942.1 phosphoglycolate phosphatase [Desulfosarcina ovata subsp. sediminis]
MNTISKDHSGPNGVRGIIFDLDGTLLNTLADIGDSINGMLAEYGFPGHTMDDYRRFIGNGIRMLVMRALPIEGRSSEIMEQCVRRARERYWDNWNRKTRPYDGINELIDALETKGLPKAVLSNKPHDFTVRYIDEYFKGRHFSVVLGQSERFPVKPDPASALEIARQLDLPPSTILFVGDSIVDVQTATAAGMRPVGVGWGFKGTGDLKVNGCPTIVEHPLDILGLI